MNLRQSFKRILLGSLVAGTMAMFAMPATASAHDWHHRWGRDHCDFRHDNGNHWGWYRHHDRDCDDDDDRPVYNNYYYQRRRPYAYYGGPAYSPSPYANYGPYGPYANYAQPFGMNGGGLQAKAARAEAIRERALANGNFRRAHKESERLQDIREAMRRRHGFGARYYNRYNQGYYNSGYYGGGYDPYDSGSYDPSYNQGYYNNGYGGSMMAPLLNSFLGGY